MHADESGLNDISQLFIGGALTVLNVLGAGFLEKIYRNAPHIEVRTGSLLVELKAVEALGEAHHAQCIDYLKASDPRLGLLRNFGIKRLEMKRVANHSKPLHLRNSVRRLADLR